MTYKQFYEAIENIDIEEEYQIYTRYTQEHEQILALIAELEATQNKNLDNLRHKYLPKKLSFDTVIKTAVISKNIRFINESEKYKKVLEEYDKTHYIGYFTTNATVKFYNVNDKSYKQCSLPKKGILIEQNEDIEVIENKSKRQRRSDIKYQNLQYVKDIEIENTHFTKRLFNII